MKKLLIALLAVLVMATAACAEAVFATKNGKKYHKPECVFIKDRETSKIDDKDAIAKGLKPCGKCMTAGEKLSKKEK
ncbi:MAG: hypothetical protein A2787_08080 [Omnitrophica WOR_2 bacterium RIFCSPHIGHO2_01_FULL_48_9]|nr:MAG: hypothetical protein A3D10_04145 [Omnitrophica WOR_2 bacterium RIFCSPHIGHO2_02_FULL_48_11]OGX31373.1 MAG: hypothetical protein A2787_08080 [Omnitrophica WOR_2 bacterium RIFCSPHIGHO2_01_FULL_48_9]